MKEGAGEGAALQARSEGFNLERKAETGGGGGKVCISAEAKFF